MINQASIIGFGTDATILSGYALAANDRLGNFDLVVENVGTNTLNLTVKELNMVSGYNTVITPWISVVPKGTKTISFSGILSQQIGFFGSGNTTANISTVLRNPANLRGASIDIVAQGHRGFGWDQAFGSKAFRSPGYGAFPDVPTAPLG